MEDIVVAIQQLSQKTCLDYLQVWVPILLSLVAVTISICTARKQNRIALFEKRISVLSIAEMLICYAESINDVDVKNHKILFSIYNSAFGTSITSINSESATAFYYSLKQIEKDLLMANYLFGKEEAKQLEDICGLLNDFMTSIFSGKPDGQIKTAFCSACLSFDAALLKGMEKKVKL